MPLPKRQRIEILAQAREGVDVVIGDETMFVGANVDEKVCSAADTPKTHFD